jgi:hypothetical protein
MRSLGDDEVLSLSVDAAEVMTDDDLRTIFVEMVVMLRGEFGDDAMPEGFPDEPWDMSREETLAAVRKYPYWFDPPGGHPPTGQSG